VPAAVPRGREPCGAAAREWVEHHATVFAAGLDASFCELDWHDCEVRLGERCRRYGPYVTGVTSAVVFEVPPLARDGTSGLPRNSRRVTNGIIPDGLSLRARVVFHRLPYRREVEPVLA